MEAMWTRFQPLTLEVKRIAEEGTLGDPVLLHADLSHDFDIQSKHVLSAVISCLTIPKISRRRTECWTHI